jgi:hypothetical protein
MSLDCNYTQHLPWNGVMLNFICEFGRTGKVVEKSKFLIVVLMKDSDFMSTGK